MRKALIFLSAIVVAAGCGGSDSSNPINTPNPFAGRYVGTWVSPSNGNNTGTADITVTTNGAVSGTLHDDGSDSDGSITGTIASTGQIAGKSSYPGSADIPLTGTLALNSSNHLVGTVQQHVGSVLVGVNFDLTKQ